MGATRQTWVSNQQWKSTTKSPNPSYHSADKQFWSEIIDKRYEESINLANCLVKQVKPAIFHYRAYHLQLSLWESGCGTTVRYQSLLSFERSTRRAALRWSVSQGKEQCCLHCGLIVNGFLYAWRALLHYSVWASLKLHRQSSCLSSLAEETVCYFCWEPIS